MWHEIDEEQREWVVPASRMKRRLAHKVPLSDAAMQVLVQAFNATGGTGLLFPSPTGRALTDNALSKVCRENDVGCVPHGLRSSFRTWVADLPDVSGEVGEHALHHLTGSKVQQSYQRSDMYMKRQDLMQRWADRIAYTCPPTEHRVTV